MWPDGHIFLIVSHLQQLTFPKLLISSQHFGKDFKIFAKLAKFRQIWSHCWYLFEQFLYLEQAEYFCNKNIKMYYIESDKETEEEEAAKIFVFIKKLNICLWQVLFESLKDFQMLPTPPLIIDALKILLWNFYDRLTK